jgi:DNA-directed RNA polymerase specialized sigma24 family protein
MERATLRGQRMIAAFCFDEAMTIARLRQWASLRVKLNHGCAVRLKSGAWQRRDESRFDAAHVRVIDFERALGMLPERERVALILRYRDGQRDPETAIMLGCSLRTVGNLIPQARRRLAGILDRLNLL